MSEGPFIIVFTRTPEHIFGENKTPMGRGGTLLTFDTEAEAIEHARGLNQTYGTRNAVYTVQRKGEVPHDPQVPKTKTRSHKKAED